MPPHSVPNRAHLGLTGLDLLHAAFQFSLRAANMNMHLDGQSQIPGLAHTRNRQEKYDSMLYLDGAYFYVLLAS